MFFRKGALPDLDAICQLVEAVKEDMKNQGIIQWDDLYPTIEDFSDDISKDSLYVAEDARGILGIYVINEESDEEYADCKWENPDATACILHRLCISPICQHQGIGRQVLQHIEEQAKSLSYESIRLDVFTQNPHAVRLYTKSNYAERGHVDWRMGRFLLMEKKL